jgi:hypothetical protein
VRPIHVRVCQRRSTRPVFGQFVPCRSALRWGGGLNLTGSKPTYLHHVYRITLVGPRTDCSQRCQRRILPLFVTHVRDDLAMIMLPTFRFKAPAHMCRTRRNHTRRRCCVGRAGFSDWRSPDYGRRLICAIHFRVDFINLFCKDQIDPSQPAFPHLR